MTKPDDDRDIPLAAPTPAAAPPGRFMGTPIETDCPCVYCKYNLRKLPRFGRCPECGRPVQDSFGDTTFRQLSIGWAGTMMVAALVVALAFFGLALAAVSYRVAHGAIAAWLIVIAIPVLAVGGLALAIPQPRRPGSSRIPPLLLGVASLLLAGMYAWAYYSEDPSAMLAIISLGAYLCLLGLRLSILARQFENHTLADRLLLLGVGGGGMIVLAGLTLKFLWFVLAAFLLLLGNISILIIFGIWGVYVIFFVRQMWWAIAQANAERR